MRKLFILTCIMTGVFVACSNDEVANNLEEVANGSDSVIVNSGKAGKLILPVDVTGSPIEEFFNAELRNTAKAFFYDTQGDHPKGEDFVSVINSRQEFAAIYQGKKELPEVDFGKYTLIIGKVMMPYLGFYIDKKELLTGEDALKLTIYTKNDNEILACALQHLYYWGLYPKQSQKTVSVNCFMKYPK